MSAAIDVAPEAREQVASDLRQAAKKAADAVGEILRWSYMLESEPDAAMKSMRSALCSTVKNRNGVKAAAAETALTVLAPDQVGDCHAKRQGKEATQTEERTRARARSAAEIALRISGTVPGNYMLTELCHDVSNVCSAAVAFAMDDTTTYRRRRKAIEEWQAENGTLTDAANIAEHKRKVAQYFPRSSALHEPSPPKAPSVKGKDGNVVAVEFGGAS